MEEAGSVEDRVQALLESNEANFNEWTNLIAEVEDSSPDDLQKICLVYDSFLSEFPLCYGYWTRYAGHKARLCTVKEAEEVYEQAVKIASHSVHLWVSYCHFAMLSFEDSADVRRLFERGLSYVDKDYLCHLLWDKYIEFEYYQKQWNRLAHIYINTLRFPTKKLRSYYESFKKLVALLEEQMGSQNAKTIPPETVPDSEMTNENEKDCRYSEVSNAVDLLCQSPTGLEELKEFLSIGELLYHKSSLLDKSISCFEAHIRRQYFHMKPLDEFQLENWHDYLTFAEEGGNFVWTVKLYERCLIPCANYSEFWIRYVDFVDAKGGREIANYALERALKVFLKRIPAFHQYYSMFKERTRDAVNACAPFIRTSEDCAIDVIENVSRMANIEKRLGNIEAAQHIYDQAIKTAHEKQNSKLLPHLYINFARFTFVVTGNADAANDVFIKGIQQNPCKLIIEGFLDFIIMHGGTNHIDSVDCKMNDLLAPESEVSRALSSQEREEISQLYLKFVDLHGTIYQIIKAWDRHRKLFPHILRPPSLYDYSSNGIQIQSWKTDGPQGMKTSLPNLSSEKPRKNFLVKQVENVSPINMPIFLPEETHECELKSSGKADNEKGSQETIASETVRIHELSSPRGSEVDAINKSVNESQNEDLILDASSEYFEAEMSSRSSIKEISHGDLEPPALDKLLISSTDYTTRQIGTVTSDDKNTPQDATSKEDGNRFKGDGEVSVKHSSTEKNLKSESSFLAKLPEDDSLSHPKTEAEGQLKFQEKLNTNQTTLPVNAEYPQSASGGGQLAQLCYGVQSFPDPNSMLCSYAPSPHPQQWQAHAQMQNQVGLTNQQMFLTQSNIYQSPSLPNSQDPQTSHAQLQYLLASSQPYTNPGHAFLGQNAQQTPIMYAPDQKVQHASSQTQIQTYQYLPQSDEQFGYYQNAQGFPPHIWQYYQNLYYLQLQQLQQRQQDQEMIINSHRKQLTDPSELRNSQQELLDKQGEQAQLKVHTDTQQHPRNLDDKLNVAKQHQNQDKKQEESERSNQQSMQTITYEQAQQLYLQQQQHFYLQQQQHNQMYMQQQHLLQQQQHQQLLLFQQQQVLQIQHQQTLLQQQNPILPSLQHQTNALEVKSAESNLFTQGKDDPLQSSDQSAT